MNSKRQQPEQMRIYAFGKLAKILERYGNTAIWMKASLRLWTGLEMNFMKCCIETEFISIKRNQIWIKKN
jgi:sulfur relay (sulfurtransferase) DsrF/TusC family protein